MQNRMREHSLTEAEIEDLLARAQVGRLATLSPAGYPYVVPVHFVHHRGKIYAHGLPQGQKLENIARDMRVGFEVDEMAGLLLDGAANACDVNTEYCSAIIRGNAILLTETSAKKEALDRIVDKYVPQFSGRELPEAMVNGTAVIEISVVECTGKYFR